MSVTGLCRLALNTLLLKHLGSYLANNSESVTRKVVSLSAERLPFLKPSLLFVDGLVVSCCVSRLWHQMPPSASKLFAYGEVGKLTFWGEYELMCLPGKFWDNPIQIALGNHCRSNHSRVGLACRACTLRPRSWANFKLASEDRCDEREEHTLGKLLFVVTFYWQEPGVEEAMFSYPWWSANWVHYMCTVSVCLFQLMWIFRPFCAEFFFFPQNVPFISLMMTAFPLPLLRHSLWFPLHFHHMSVKQCAFTFTLPQ